MLSLADRRLYGIVDLGYVETTADAVIGATRSLIDGGIDLIQFRARGAPIELICGTWGALILPLTRDASVPLIVNDYPQIAADLDADGVHLGQDDGDLDTARAIVGDGKFVGCSTHSIAQALAARAEGADYIGFGPIFSTPTKPGRPAIGSDDIAAVHEQLGPDYPIYCIGGIKRENAPDLVAGGARRIVIVSGILQAEDIPGYIRDVKKITESNHLTLNHHLINYERTHFRFHRPRSR